MKRFLRGLAAALFAGTAALSLGTDVIVLKGGAVIELAKPTVRRHNTVYITRADGTVVSVKAWEIDREKTAVANKARPPAPAPKETPEASTPAEAVRAGQGVPKARVRITDDDVSHPLEAGPAVTEEKKDQGPGGPRVELADYTQEKSGAALVVKGMIRNTGQGTAENVRMTITAIDEKGAPIDGVTANLSKGAVESGRSVEFNASLNVGDRTVASLRFAPLWSGPKPVAAPSPRPGSAGSAAPNRPPAPAPTPFGRGTLYAAPVANAPSEPPADGKTGYIPGASSPSNQPKPPVP